ncbi:hypothetical protein [Marinicella meishanensis]|uniref:hypothetical protein n=1 Tax=Marinicella meishanensis TaxID=2873263 RepID=UPI001CBF4B2E|nr:hypothetical protein [Marinicella sp. NBU2979]
MRNWLCVVAVLGLGACAASLEKVAIESQQTTVDGIGIVSNHPDVINTYIQPVGNQSVICLEPDPDYSSAFQGGFSVGATAGGDSGNISGSQGETVVTAGGLSPLVLLAREMLYRACELSMNTNASPEQQIAIYQTFLKSIETISQAATGTGTQPTQPNPSTPSQQ